MNYQLLWIVMNAIFASYVLSIALIYGVQKSISESFYALPKKWNFLFTLAMWGFAFPAAILANGDPFMFFAAAGIVFVGAAAPMHEPFVRKVHLTAAIGGISSGELSIILVHNHWEITALSAILFLPFFLFSRKTCIWWGEIIAFAGISYEFYLQYF
jgi:hypothetical protein